MSDDLYGGRVAQRYGHPIAIERMSKGLCPECGHYVDAHTGTGGPRCSLTDLGVAARIRQFELDSFQVFTLRVVARKRPTNEVTGDAWKPNPADVVEDFTHVLELAAEDCGYVYASVEVAL